MAEYVKCALISNNDKVESGGDDKQRNEREREREREREGQIERERECCSLDRE